MKNRISISEFRSLTGTTASGRSLRDVAACAVEAGRAPVSTPVALPGVCAYTLTLPYPPALNRLWRNYRGVTVLSEAGRRYKASVGHLARSQGAVRMAGLVAVEFRIYRPRRARDLDANFKAVLDALNGAAWDDDSQIVELHAYRHEDKRNPRIELRIWDLK